MERKNSGSMEQDGFWNRERSVNVHIGRVLDDAMEEEAMRLISCQWTVKKEQCWCRPHKLQFGRKFVDF